LQKGGRLHAGRPDHELGRNELAACQFHPVGAHRCDGRVGSHVWSKLSDEDKKIFEDVLKEASAKSTDQIRASELKLADEFRKLGKTVVEVDREAFRKVAVPLHNDPSAGAGWSQAEYDALQALK